MLADDIHEAKKQILLWRYHLSQLRTEKLRRQIRSLMAQPTLWESADTDTRVTYPEVQSKGLEKNV